MMLFRYNFLKVFKHDSLIIMRFVSQNAVSKQDSLKSFDGKIKSPFGETVIELNEKTLTGRLLVYLQNQNKTKIQNKNIFVKQEHRQLSKQIFNQVLKMDSYQFEYLNLVLINDVILKLNNQENFVNKQVVHALDVICLAHIREFTNEQIFYLLHTFMNAVSNRITDFNFYKAAILLIEERIDKCSKSDLLNLLFYIGLEKKSDLFKFVFNKILNKLFQLEMCLELKIEELCIICNSAFKTGTKIKNELILEMVKETINNNLVILNDPPLFVTLLKTLRHNRYQDDDILNTITHTIFFNKTINCYSFCGICHILATYSDYLYYEESILKLLIETGINLIANDNNKNIHNHSKKEEIRMKDIRSFLWSTSNINYENFDNSFCKNIIVPKILELVKNNKEHKFDTEYIIESILYMWILGYKAYELFGVLTLDHFQRIKDQKSRCKYRFNLLLSVIKLEKKEIFTKLDIKPKGEQYNLKYQVKARPTLNRVYKNLKCISKTLPVNVFEMNFQIPFLNIVGITGFKRNAYKAVNIEILDEYTSVKNKSCHPTGLMKLKLRILRKTDEPLIIICHEEVQNMNDEELCVYLEEELEYL